MRAFLSKLSIHAIIVAVTAGLLICFVSGRGVNPSLSVIGIVYTIHFSFSMFAVLVLQGDQSEGGLLAYFGANALLQSILSCFVAACFWLTH